MENLLREKLNNFKTFCHNKFPDNEMIKKQSNNLCEIPIHVFVEYIKMHLLQYKNEFDTFYDKMIKEYQIDLEKIESVDQEKFKKYFHFFIEFVENL